MAKAYRAKHDVTLSRVVARTGEKDEDVVTEGVNYPAGALVKGDSLTPRDQKRLEGGELDHLLEEASDVDADNVPDSAYDVEPEFGVFVPEHEAEAHALEQYGHHVVPREQEMELLSSSAEHAAAYQQQVKEGGYDRRPNQEATSPENRQRIPDEYFEGFAESGATRAGMPFNRGPAQAQEGHKIADEEEGSGERPGDPTAPSRPAPGVAETPEQPTGESESGPAGEEGHEV